eukprot:1870797-Prymnesium_polylepis.1
MLSRASIPSHVALDAGAGRRPLGGGSHPCGKIGNRAFVAHHGRAQGFCIVFLHSHAPSVMLR